MAEIRHQEPELLLEGLLDVGGSGAHLFARTLGVVEAHGELTTWAVSASSLPGAGNA